MAAQGAELLLRQVPRALSPLGVQKARALEGLNIPFPGDARNSLRKHPSSVALAPPDNYTYRVGQEISRAPQIDVRVLIGFVVRLGLPGPQEHGEAAQETPVC